MKNEKNILSPLSNKILATLFLSNKEVYFSELTEKLNTTEQEIKLNIIELNKYLEPSALIISITDKSALLMVKKEYVEPKDISETSPVQLTNQALETLAVIIYKQPCSKQEIEKIRKVDCEKTLQTLINIGFVQKIAVMNQPGNPILYSVTEKCIHAFGFKTYEDMLEFIKNKIKVND